MYSPHRNEGSTIPLVNYGVDVDEGYGDEGVQYVVIHYVGGEDYVHVYHWYDTKAEAQAVAAHLNVTLPPEGYTHYYYSE